MRRGMTLEGTLVTIAVFGIVAIILIMFYNQLYGIGKSQFTEKECQASLLLTRVVDNAQKKICAVEAKNPIPIKCTRNLLTISKDEVTKNSKDVTTKYDPKCPSGQATCLQEHALAEEMRSCWRLMLEGEQVIFQQLEINEANILKTDNKKRACFVCAEINLKDATTDMTKYLQNTKMTNDQNYYQYLTHRKAYCTDEVKGNYPSCWEGIANFRNDKINQGALQPGSYAVTFVRQGMGSCEANKPESIGFSVQVIPSKDIGKQCDVVLI